MDTKLTVKLNKRTIDRAKRYAKKHNTSLSKLLERYLNSVTSEETDDVGSDIEISPLVKSMTGVISIPDDVNYKDIYHQHLDEKYGIK
jgi:hypothetical protein